MPRYISPENPREIGTEPHLMLQTFEEVILPGLERREARVLPSMERSVGDVEGLGGRFWPRASYGLHSHNDFEWMCLLNGSSYMQLGDAIYQLQPGDCCLLPPFLMHGEVTGRSFEPYQAFWCSFRAAEISMRHICYETPQREGILRWCVVPTPSTLASLLLVIQSEVWGGQAHSGAVGRSLMFAVMQLLMRSLETTQELRTEVRVTGFVSRHVMTYLQTNYARDISLHDVAREVHLSDNYLASLFKQETGRTVGEALTAIRLERAKQLLAEGNLSVNAIAHATGYSSPEYFCRVFRQHEKIAPSRYSASRLNK